MSRALLLSVRPKWCALMMNGIKKIEVRKGTALYKAIQKLIDEYGFAEFYVYCCKGKQGIFKERHNGYTLLNQNKWIQSERNGKVIFKFRCYKVEEILPFEEYESPFGMAYKLTKDKIVCCQKAQLTYDEYNHYLKGKKGCAIHISDLEIFDKPKELSEFYGKDYEEIEITTLCDDKPLFKRIKKPLTKAPQSFCYIEVGE